MSAGFPVASSVTAERRTEGRSAACYSIVSASEGREVSVTPPPPPSFPYWRWIPQWTTHSSIPVPLFMTRYPLKWHERVGVCALGCTSVCECVCVCVLARTCISFTFVFKLLLVSKHLIIFFFTFSHLSTSWGQMSTSCQQTITQFVCFCLGSNCWLTTVSVGTFYFLISGWRLNKETIVAGLNLASNLCSSL